MSDCLFCGIAAGSVPARIVHRDDEILAFEDIHPQAPIHVLVIPRRHVASLDGAGDGDGALLGRLLLTVRDVARAKGLDARGYRVVANTLASAGQSVFHLHFHLLGGRRFSWPPG